MSQDVRDRILSAAVDLFMEQGFGTTSVRSIGERANVGQSSLYHHAQSKMQLLYDIHQRFLARLKELLAREVDPTASASVQLRHFIGSIMELMQSHRSEITIFLREGHHLPPEMHGEIRRERDHVDASLDAILERGIRSGEFDLPPDVRVVRLAILGMCNWSYQWYDERGPHSVEDLTDLLTDFVLDGLRPRPGDVEQPAFQSVAGSHEPR